MSAQNPTKFDEILNDAIFDGRVASEDRNLVFLAAWRYLHSTGDAGRPSDAMRSTVRRYTRIGREEFHRVESTN
jgi:hypothetical protein